MNQKAQYEITIAEKLEHLTVPDMVDAIWSRIETQLDIDLPTDDGPSEPPSNPPAGGGSWVSPALFIAFTVFITTLYFTNRKKPDIVPAQPGIENSPALITPSGSNPVNPSGPPGNDVTPRRNQPGSVTPGMPFFDSLANLAGGLQVPVTDSNLNKGGIIQPTSIAPLVINPPDSSKKKPRGVKGITDDDYRVVPASKDSSNRR